MVSTCGETNPEDQETWERDKQWSDGFLPEIKRNLGEHLMGEPPVEEDQERNTDLITLWMSPVRIACRIRKPDAWQYRDDFTIRYSRPRGTKTELTKIIEGYGDYIFYGHADEDGHSLRAWGLGNLGALRIWFSRYLATNNGRVPGFSMPNTDNSSTFRVFKWNDIPEFVVAHSNLPINETAPHSPLAGQIGATNSTEPRR